jgi:hypothetical protein
MLTCANFEVTDYFMCNKCDTEARHNRSHVLARRPETTPPRSRSRSPDGRVHFIATPPRTLDGDVLKRVEGQLAEMEAKLVERQSSVDEKLHQLQSDISDLKAYLERNVQQFSR